jgi:hypothetical protein
VDESRSNLAGKLSLPAIRKTRLSFKESLPRYETHLGNLIDGAVAWLAGTFPPLREPVEKFH